jgi:two-component system, LytTR family, sensor kinase
VAGNHDLVSTAESRVYPPVHRLTTRGQFLVFALMMVSLVGAIAFPAARDYQGRGYNVTWAYTLTENLLSLAFLLAVARPVWRVLDGTPLAPGRRRRNLAARLLCCGVYAVAEGTWTHAATVSTVWLFGVDARMLAEPDKQWGQQILAANFGFLFLLAAHIVLQRSHQRQQLLLVERSLAEFRLQALSLELQPHFLFNTLNAIASLSREDPARAERMVLRLSDLLRMTLDSGTNGAVPLQRELEHLDLYLDLQEMRFGPRLTVVRDFDPGTLGAKVPGLLLQPLVENALTHGIGPRAGPGRLELTSRREGETLVLRVRDDGVGLPPEAERRERTGVGTTRARLAAMFGSAQAFTLRPAPGGGTLAEVRIPFTPTPPA